MMLPAKYGGTHFLFSVSPDLPDIKTFCLIYLTTLSDGNTRIRFLPSQQVEHMKGKGQLGIRGFIELLLEGKDPQLSASNIVEIVTDAPVSVTVQKQTGFINAAMATYLLLPVHMHRHSFVIRPSQHYKTVVVNLLALSPFDHLLIPEDILADATVDSVTTNRSVYLEQWWLPYPNRTITIQSVPCTIKFAVYIHYFTHLKYFDSVPVNFAFVQLPPEVCNKSETNRYDDYLDNDCDGRVDEEPKDEIDNDGDKLIDEDTCQEITDMGGWSMWSPWSDCDLDKCRYTRYRPCDHPYPAIRGDPCNTRSSFSMEFKYMQGCGGSTCPLDCPKGTYSTHCSYCDPMCTDCDQITGLCNHCQNGTYTDQRRCAACPFGKWGKQCGQNCDIFCLTICDNATGFCEKGEQNPESPLPLELAVVPILILLTLILLLGFFCCTCISRKKKPAELKSSNNKPSVSVTTVSDDLESISSIGSLEEGS